VEPSNLRSGENRKDGFPELTAQPSDDSTADSNDNPATDDTDSESEVAADDTPAVVQPPRSENSNVVPISTHNGDATGMAGDADNAPTLLAERVPRIEGDAGRTVRREIQRPPIPVLAATQAVSAANYLIKIVDWDGTSQDIEQVLTAAFDAKDYLECIKDLRARNIEPLSYINSLDKIIDGLSIDSDLRKRCIRALSGTCGLYGIFPTSHVFPFKLSKPGRRPFASGRFTDVWRLVDEENRDRVFAIVEPRVYEVDSIEKINEIYCKAAIVSKRMNHPNVLSIEGVAPELFRYGMVSQWMSNGDMLDYVTRHPEVNRLELLIGVTRGLDYLHNNEVVLGDLKGPNVLIDAKGNPRLYNFTHCSFTKITDPANVLAPVCGLTIRYSAPERLSMDGPDEPTTMSDVYALSMVIVELTTGKMPFPGHTDRTVLTAVPKGQRPLKPLHFDAPGMTSAVWKIATECWHQKAKKRPKVNAVLQSLENLSNPDGRNARTPLLRRLRQVFDD